MESATTEGDHRRLPTAHRAVARDREDAAGERNRPVRLLADLDPQLAEPMVVAQLVTEIDLVAEVRVRLADGAPDGEAFEPEPRGDPHRRADEEQQVREVAEQTDAARA